MVKPNIKPDAQHEGAEKRYDPIERVGLTEDQERIFREGIPLHGRKTSPAEIKIIKHGANPWYEVKITEGRQNQIRMIGLKAASA